MENSEGLAPVMVLVLKHIIGRLKEGGLSVLLVEQNVAMALAVSDYAYTGEKGASS